MVPNINANSRARKRPKRGCKPLFDPAIFEERFRTIERLFAWEDKFRRLLLRFERLSQLHYAFKTLAFDDQSEALLPGLISPSRMCLKSGAPRRDSARPLHCETTLMTVPIIPSPALSGPR